MGWRVRLSDKTVRKFAELPIYCQRQKCSPGILVSSKISLMRIFANANIGSLERGRQMRVGWSKMEIFTSFARYIFRTFTSKATFITLYYVAHYSRGPCVISFVSFVKIDFSLNLAYEYIQDEEKLCCHFFCYPEHV